MLAIATHIAPTQLMQEDDVMIVTLVDELAQQAEEIQKASGKHG